MRALALLLLFTSSLSAAEPTREILRARFEASVRSIVDEVDGVMGVTIEDLKSGERLSLNGDLVFTQASAIKLPLLVELFRQAEDGRHDLDAPVTLTEGDVVPGSGVLRRLTAGQVTMTLLDIATLMIIVSDNTATNMIIDRVGMDQVNETMARLGLGETKLQRKMMDADAWSENRENLSTPNEQAKLLALLVDPDDTLLSEASREEIPAHPRDPEVEPNPPRPPRGDARRSQDRLARGRRRGCRARVPRGPRLRDLDDGQLAVRRGPRRRSHVAYLRRSLRVRRPHRELERLRTPEVRRR